MRHRKYQELNIATGYIRGVNVHPKIDPAYFDYEQVVYVWFLYFEKTSAKVNNIRVVLDTHFREGAERFYQKVKENFEKANVRENDRVTIIFTNDGSIVAIGNRIQDKWIDVNDSQFAVKSFNDFEIVVTGLKSYI